MTLSCKRNLNAACRSLIMKIKPDAENVNDLCYNHGIRVMSAQVREVISYSKDDVTTEHFIALAADRYLIQDPERSSDFAFNSGVCDALDVIRGYLG